MKRARIHLPAAILCAAALLGSPGPAPGQEGPPEPRGDVRCAECHAEESAAHARGPHGAAKARLSESERNDAACAACHAPSGDGRQVVGCADCHGEGYLCGDWNAATAAGRRMPGEARCVDCHRATARHPEMDFQFTRDHPLVEHAKRERDPFSLDGVYRRFVSFTKADGLPDDKVFAVKVHGTDVWAGTEKGLALLRDGRWRSFGRADGLVHEAVTSLDVDRATGEVFAGTLGGVSVYDGKGFTNLTEESAGLVNNAVFGVALLQDDLWVATFDGISRYDRKAKRCRNYRLDEAPLDEVWIYGCEAGRDRVNFAVWGGGFVEWIAGREHWQAYRDPDGVLELDLFRNDGITTDVVTGVSSDDGQVWLSSYFGLSRYDGRDWFEYNEDDSGLPSNFINSVKARRREGWCATDKGLACLDLRRNRWVGYRRLEGPRPQLQVEIADLAGTERRRFVCDTALPHDFTWGIDFQGEEIWVATSKGLARGSYGTDPLHPAGLFLRAPEAAPRTPASDREPVGLLDAKLLGEGFAQTVLGPEYTQPYVFFARPHSVPLSKDYSDFVDPVGRDDTSFENEPEVRIGFLGCLSGPAKSYSEEMLRGARLAQEEINASGGYRGKPLVLKVRDDKAVMGRTANETVGLIYEDRVLAFLGSMSSDTTHVAQRLALKGECAQLTSISTDPTITQVFIPWIFRCLADDWSQSRALAKLIFRDRGFRKVALLERNNRYGRMGSAELKRVAKRMKRPITLSMRYGPTADFVDYARRIRDYGADAVVIWGLYADASQIVRALKAEGLEIPVFGADGLVSQAFIDMAGEAAEGVLVTYPYDYYRDDPLTQEFNARFRERYGHEPDSFAAHGYDAMHLLWKAVQRGGLNRTRIRDALAETRDFHGVTGMISFDLRGNDMRGVDFAVVHDGKFLPLRVAGEHARKGRHEK